MAAPSSWPSSKRPARRRVSFSSSCRRAAPSSTARLASRTYREEFYDCSTATPTVAGFAQELRDWEHTYNHIRPHQALGYLTPAEFLANLNAAQPREELSRT